MSSYISLGDEVIKGNTISKDGETIDIENKYFNQYRWLQDMQLYKDSEDKY